MLNNHFLLDSNSESVNDVLPVAFVVILPDLAFEDIDMKLLDK